jgi:propanol-preferring alcohol dehydrogenase
MKALQLVRFQHDPELREVPEPEPAPGQVVVRIAAAGACHSDLHILHDFPAGLVPWPVPMTLGHENAGYVHAIGAGVTGVEVGEPVAVYGPWGCGRCHRCRTGAENYCAHAAESVVAGGGLGTHGGMAPLMLVPSPRFLVPLGSLDPVLAAPLTDAGLTPYHAIKRSLALLQPGATVVVIGVGGLGHLGVQILAATTAATIIAVDQKPTALALATSVGADHTVTAAEAVAEIRGRTGGIGADVVLDFVGSDATLGLAAGVVRSNGHVTIVGLAGGALPVGMGRVPYGVSVSLTYWGTVTELIEVIGLAQAGRIEPHIERFPLDRAADAYERLHAGLVQGRAVITP